MGDAKRRFLESTTATATFIGPGSVFVGNVEGPGAFVICGEVHGDGRLGGALTLSVSGAWHGNVHARQAIVAGTIIGELIVQDKLEIGHSAVIRGKVSARTIAIAKGAIVEGEVSITSGEPMQQFEEKRRAG